MSDPNESVTVLVADDEVELTDLFDMWLSSHYNVRTAYDGEEALERMDDSVAVAFLDRRMPNRSGDEVANAIAENYPDTRIVFVSSERLTTLDADATFDAYLTKPVDQADLLDVAEMLISDRNEPRDSTNGDYELQH